jgi:hypothetical protein
MEWAQWSWDEVFGDSVDPRLNYRRQKGPQVSPNTGADSSFLDTWLIALVYSAIAAGSSCETCGCRLGRKLRVFSPPPAGARGPRQLLVVAKCRSWKRHVHVATVVINEGDDTVLRPLRATDGGLGPAT